MPLVFHIWALPKWARTPTPQFAALKRVGHQSFAVSLYLPGDDGLVVSPEVPPRLRRYKRCETSSCQRESLSLALACTARRLVARQPIFDRAQNVFGYEILFRKDVEDYFTGSTYRHKPAFQFAVRMMLYVPSLVTAAWTAPLP